MQRSIFSSLLKDLGPILVRNIFTLVVVIIGGLSAILLLLGETRDAFFLFLVVAVNIVVGLVQEIRSRVALEKLQAKTTAKYRLNSDKGIKVFAEEIKVSDKIFLELGEQVPVDGKIIKTSGSEFNEGLLTGESANITKKEGDKIRAGSIVVAGNLILQATQTAQNSYYAAMTSTLKRYKRNLSPIQHSLLRFIKLMAAVLVIISIFILFRGYLVESSLVESVRQIAAIASTIIAEGLILTSTALFAYGAIRLSQQQVLSQQINAIEGLGRIQYLCIDKTGTLTEEQPSYESLITSPSSEANLKEIVSQYTYSELAQTATISALQAKFSKPNKIITKNFVAFSSARKYSAFGLNGKKYVIGASDYFSDKCSNSDKRWLNKQLKALSMSAKRILFVAEVISGEYNSLADIKKVKATGLVVLHNPLKKGTKEIIDFLQHRGISVIVISGDNPNTVAAIAGEAGILNGPKIITGNKLNNLSDFELTRAIKANSLFARILPEQKQRIINLCKQLGYSAMIGDGANDALAIKDANVGIAMFSGSSATRQIADVVLLDSQFSALPRGIELSDTIITTLEMIGCLFFSRVWAGIILLFGSLAFNLNYPLSPRNITLLNYFIIAWPIFLWTFFPYHRTRSINEQSYLVRTLPFSILNGAVVAAFSLLAYYIANSINHLSSQARLISFGVFAVMSIFTISLIPRVIKVDEKKFENLVIYSSFVVMAAITLVIIQVPKLSSFFEIVRPTKLAILLIVMVAVAGIVIQFVSAKTGLANIIYNYYQTKKQINKNHPQQQL